MRNADSADDTPTAVIQGLAPEVDQPQDGGGEQHDGARAPRGSGRRYRPPITGLVAAVVVLALVIVFALTLWGGSGSTTAASRGAGGIAATVAAGQVGDASLTEQLSLTGTVSSGDAPVTITPATAGTVTSLSISAGQSVQAGQVVAQLSDTQGAAAKQASAQAQLAQAQAQLAAAESPASQASAVDQAQNQVAQAQAALSSAQAKLQADQAAAARQSASAPSSRTGGTPSPAGTQSPVTAQQLSQDQASVTEAQSELSAAKTELGTAESPPAASADEISADEAAVTAAQDSLDAADQAVSDLTVTAPVAGTVAQILVPVGGSAGPTAPVASLTGSLETITAQASPAQVETLDGRIGAAATVSLAVPNPTSTVSASLTSIAPSASTTTQQTAVTLTSSAALEADAPVEVTVSLPQPKGPAVPADAVVTVGGQQGVFVLSNLLDPAVLGATLPAGIPSGVQVGSAVFTPVAVGVTQGSQTQVIKGLSIGQDIVTTGQTTLAGLSGSQKVAVLPTPASGSASAQASSSASAHASAAGSGQTIDVTVVSLKGSSLTVSTSIGQKTVTVPSGFTVTANGKPMPVSQLRPGDVLKITLGKTNGKPSITSAVLQ